MPPKQVAGRCSTSNIMPRNSGRGTNFYAGGIRNNASYDDDNKGGGLNNSGAAFTPNEGDRKLVEKTKGNTVEVMPNYQAHASMVRKSLPGNF